MTIEQARCVPTLPSATVGACTLRIRNLGHDSDRLVAVESVVAGRVEIHMTSLADGIMRMRPLAQGLDIPAGALVDFRERGYHLMLLDLNARLGAGETIDASLIFARAGVLRVVFHIDERR